MSSDVLKRRQIVSGDIETVFEFFKDPKNLETITPPWLKFEVVSSTTERVQAGTEIQYRLWWQIFPMKWRSRISEFVDGELFADEMLRGPYKRWYHRHLFAQLEDGVEVVDIVEYTLPFGVLGRLVHGAVIRRQLEAIFDYRATTIDRVFGAGQTSGAPS